MLESNLIIINLFLFGIIIWGYLIIYHLFRDVDGRLRFFIFGIIIIDCIIEITNKIFR